jgi:hypothetical protein
VGDEVTFHFAAFLYSFVDSLETNSLYYYLRRILGSISRPNNITEKQPKAEHHQLAARGGGGGGGASGEQCSERARGTSAYVAHKNTHNVRKYKIGGE